MTNDFLRREWGAAAFVVVTALGIVIVPVALSLNKQNTATPAAIIGSPSPVITPTVAVTESPSPSPSPSPTASPSASPGPSASPSTSPSASPLASPSPAHS